MKKDFRVAIKNSNSNEKLAEDIKKKEYEMARHVQYIKDEMDDSRDKANCLQVEKRYVELRISHPDR